MLIIFQSIRARKNTWLVSLTPAAALQSKMRRLRRAARGGLSSLAAAGPPCSEAWTGQIVGDYICFCTPEMFHIQWELWTCAISIEPHWCQWGRCTEISLTDIISFLLLSLAENKCSNREILGCRGWSQQLNTKQMTFAASEKSPAEQQGGTDLQQAAVSCVWSGRHGVLTPWACAGACCSEVAIEHEVTWHGHTAFLR